MSNYTPAVSVSDVTVGTINVESTLSALGQINRPFIVANVSKLTASGIRYSITYDASGQRNVAGASASGFISLSGLQAACTYSTWNTPASISFLTASFVYASGTERSIGIDLAKAESALPRASIGHQLSYVLSNILGLTTPTQYSSAFADVDALASALNSNIASWLKTTLELQSTQDSMLKAVLRANGPLINVTASGTYTLQVNGSVTDVIVATELRNITCNRNAYGKTNTLIIPSSIPVLLRFTSLLPDILYDVDTMSTFTANQQITTLVNTGTAGSQFNATPSGAIGVLMRIDPNNGRRYLETKGANQGFLNIPSGMSFMYATDAPMLGFTIAYVYRLTGNVDGNFLKINSLNSAQFTHAASAAPSLTVNSVNSSSGFLTVDNVNASMNAYTYDGSWIIMVLSFRHNLVPVISWIMNNTAIFKAYKIGTTNVPLTTGVASCGPADLYNINTDIKAFHMYRYGMSASQMDDLIYMLKQQYNV